MKKILFVIFIELLALPALFAQIHLSFTGKDVLDQHVTLHHVDIHNVTQDWTQTIYYPDTTLELTYVGIEDHNPSTPESTGLTLSQNIPNPFDGSTRFSIHLPYNDDVNINIYDINGRLVLRDSRSLTAGNHVFRLTLGTAQSYVLSVRGSKERASIKMVNLSSKGNNRIEYESSTIDVELKVESGKGVMEYPFNEGDLIQFTGYVRLDTFLASNTIEQTVSDDANIELVFPAWMTLENLYNYINDSTLYIPVNGNCIGGCFLYRTFDVHEFDSTDTIQSEEDIAFVRLKMEHSFISDLWISLVCPNGQYATILRKGNNGNNCQSSIPNTEIGWQGVSTSQAYFGCYNSNNSSSCDPANNPMGECWNYCWANDTTQGYQYACGNSHVYELCNHITVNNPHGNSNDKYVDSSDVANMTNIYKPDDSFSKLIGCPLNGTWKIQIIDGNSGDNGYLEEAELVFGNRIDTIYHVLTIPEVSTDSRVFITSDSAVCYGQVIHDGYSAVTERGVCWDVNPNPDVNGPHAVEGAGTGTFSVTASSLTPGQTYYYRCYAINAIGIGYGEEKSFTALDTACNSTLTLTDYDGNVYHMVRLGTQCWMKENLRTTHYPNGEEIPVFVNNDMTGTPYRYANGDVNIYGYNYNWHAAAYNVPATETTTLQGVCPNGWHLPSLAEWNTLRNYVESQSNYHCGDNTAYIAKALASATTDWSASSTSCAPGNEVSTNDLTGFSARPAGVHSATYPIGYCALFWTSNNSTSDKVSCFPILHMWPDISTTGVFNSMFKAYPLSVRCVRNLGFAPPAVPSVVTTNVNFITDTSAVGHGHITFIGDTLIALGICWSTTSQPTIMDSHTCDSINIGLGDFDSEITGLTSNTTYFVRAYATNNNGTAYSNEKSFRTGTGNDGQPCTVAATVTDVDGNIYNTVQIGNQCWMKENLRTTHYASSIEIPLGSSATHYDYSAQRYYPNNNAESVGTYGYLYNWAAVMNGASSSTANPSGVQGICPNGWHLPSDSEWTQLTDYVSIHSAYLCNNDMSNIGKALAATTGWNSYATTCAIGNNPNTNNSTGFSALPAGLSLSINFGNVADFWSATEETDNLHACIRILRYNEGNVMKSTYYKNYGFSVRCVRD